MTNKIYLYEVPPDGILKARAYVLSFVIFSLISLIIFYVSPSIVSGVKVSLGIIPFILLFYLYGAWDARNKEKFFIEIEEAEISFKNSSWANAHTINASEIHHIEINFDDVQIFTRDLRSFTIDIGFAKHSDIQIIKADLTKFRNKLPEQQIA